MKLADTKALDQRWTRVLAIAVWYGLYLTINAATFYATEGGVANAVLCPILLWAAAQTFSRIRRLSNATRPLEQSTDATAFGDGCSCGCRDNSLRANTPARPPATAGLFDVTPDRRYIRKDAQ